MTTEELIMSIADERETSSIKLGNLEKHVKREEIRRKLMKESESFVTIYVNIINFLNDNNFIVVNDSYDYLIKVAAALDLLYRNNYISYKEFIEDVSIKLGKSEKKVKKGLFSSYSAWKGLQNILDIGLASTNSDEWAELSKEAKFNRLKDMANELYDM